MRQAHLGGFLILAAFAALLVAGPAVASVLDDPAAEGKVSAYEAGKSIVVGEGDAKKDFKIDENTKLEGEIAVGKEVKVWAKDGVATKIALKE